MQIWDTAGMESFRSIIKTFYRSSAAVFLVYNIAKYTQHHSV
jgi:Ras-related protein Rab-2A